MKLILSLLAVSTLLLSYSVFAENINEATEPSVAGPGTIDLLEGDTLDAWKIPSDHWSIENEHIVGSTGTEKLEIPEWLYSKQRFSDFEFTCELRLTGDDARNSGIYFRATPFHFDGYKTFEAASGYEFDAGKPKPNKNNYWGSMGDWYVRPKLRLFADQAIINQAYKPEDWNRMTIRARGNRFEYWLNGIKIMDFQDPDPNGSREGSISFQIHDRSVMKAEYRNTRVLPLAK